MIVTVVVALEVVGWDELDCVEVADVESPPPHAASAKERTTTNDKAIQSNVERPRGRE